MADFENIPIEISAENLENVAKRYYIEQDRPPVGLDIGEDGQFWIYKVSDDGETRIFQRVGYNWVEYVQNNRQIAGIDLQNDITAEELQTALEIYPVLTGSDLDEIEQNIKKGQLAIFTDYDGETYTKDIYYGYSDGVATLIAGTTVNNSILPSIVEKYLEDNPIEVDGYVPQTRTIAGIDLADDITADELYTSLNIKPHTVSYTAPTESTEGRIGELYFSIQTKKMYTCVDSSNRGGETIYIWELVSNPDILTSVDSASTDEQVPSAKLFYDTVGDIESLLEALL